MSDSWTLSGLASEWIVGPDLGPGFGVAKAIPEVGGGFVVAILGSR